MHPAPVVVTWTRATERQKGDNSRMRKILMTITIAALAPSSIFAADAKAGQAVYEKSCKSCHGADGTPNAGVAKMMKVDMKDLKSSEVQSQSDADLKKIIADGKGKMKPISSVTGGAADDVVAYVRSLKK
jgi:mono/diheme cytochrome c family protein